MKTHLTRRIVAVGTSSAIVIPFQVMKKLNLKQGDFIKLENIKKDDKSN